MGFDRRYVRKVKSEPPRVIKEEVKIEEVIEEVVEQQVEEVKEEMAEENVPQLIQVEEQVNEVVELKDVIEITDETVVCINTMKFYADNKEASEETGVNAGSIKRCCNGDTKSAGKDTEGNKLVWKYAKDLE